MTKQATPITVDFPTAARLKDAGHDRETVYAWFPNAYGNWKLYLSKDIDKLGWKNLYLEDNKKFPQEFGIVYAPTFVEMIVDLPLIIDVCNVLYRLIILPAVCLKYDPSIQTAKGIIVYIKNNNYHNAAAEMVMLGLNKGWVK